MCYRMLAIIFFFFLLSQALIAAPASPIEIQTIAFESSGEPFLAQTYVAKTIQNRMKRDGKTAREVCTQPFQFSCWNPAIRNQLKTRTQSEIQSAGRAWENAFLLDSPVNLFHDVTASPKWTHHPHVTFLRRVGNLFFYYEERK